MHLPHRTHLSICLSTYTKKRKSAHSRPMVVMHASGQRLCQMVHDVGLRHGAEDRLQTVLETSWWMAAVDANYDSQLDQMIVATSNKFTVLKKLADDIAVLLQPARPGSSLPATLIGLCRCQNRRISGRGSRTVRLRRMVTGGRDMMFYPGSGPLDGGKTLCPA